MAQGRKRKGAGSRVLGVDLAAGPKKTWACVLEEKGRTLRAELHGGCDDAKLIELGKGCDKVAIDAPLGWPNAFVRAISAHRRQAPWPQRGTTDFTHLYFRETDLAVTQDRRPLSVAADKLGVTAMRCAQLLREWPGKKTPDRTGAGLFVEVYPAAALFRWGLPVKGYKGTEGGPARSKLMDRLREALPGLWLSEEDVSATKRQDDAIDALLAALVGRAAALTLTDGPPKGQRAAAAQEGWIHLPLRGSLPYVNPGAIAAFEPAQDLAELLERTADLDPDGYARRIEDVLVPTVSAKARERIEADLDDKGGSELVSKGGRAPKFFASHSSAALAANSFAPFLDGTRELTFQGHKYGGEMSLERECRTGLRGVPPTLDFMAIERGGRVLAIESKCIEPYYGPGQDAEFKKAYDRLMPDMHETWRAEMERLRQNPLRFRYLNAAQLIKHYLGVKRQFRDEAIVLGYAFWEPKGADRIAACAIHRAEILAFAEKLDDSQVKFVSVSYPELWAEWAQDLTLKKHVSALRRRYEVR